MCVKIVIECSNKLSIKSNCFYSTIFSMLGSTMTTENTFNLCNINNVILKVTPCPDAMKGSAS